VERQKLKTSLLSLTRNTEQQGLKERSKRRANRKNRRHGRTEGEFEVEQTISDGVLKKPKE